MIVQKAIEEKLKITFSPTHLEVINESSQHSVPKNSETHFRLIIVSEQFSGKNRVQRQQLVYKALSLELQNGVHALSQRTFTPTEWHENAVEFASPECLGGSKKSP